MAIVYWLIASLCAFSASTPRQTITAAIVEQDDEKKLTLISSLAGDASPDIARLLALWKEDAIYLYKTAVRRCHRRRR